MTIEVIIPTRKEPISQCITGININTPPVSDYSIIQDEGEGQTLIRYYAAKKSKADYVLILDDDVFMREGLVQKYLDKILEGYDAVCGNTNPAPIGPFGKHITQYMTNPKTPFYAVGCTLWRREKFVQIMEEVGINIHKYLGDNILQEHIKDGGYNVVRVEDAVCDHMTYVTMKNFFSKRVKYGEAIGRLSWDEKVRRDKKFTPTYLRFLFGIPLALFQGRGVFVYRLATFIGMTRFLFGVEK